MSEEIENNENLDELSMNGSDGNQITVRGSTEDLKKIKKALLDAQSVNKANERLLEENSELTSDLQLIAEKEARAKAERYGLEDFDPNNPEDLEKLKHLQIRSNTAPLNEFQTDNLSEKDRKIIADAIRGSNLSNMPTENLECENELQLIDELEHRSKAGDKTATDYLSRLVNSKKSWEMQYEGNDTKALYRNAKDPKERLEVNKKRQNWVKVK